MRFSRRDTIRIDKGYAMHELIVCKGPGTFLTKVDPAEISELRHEPGTTIWLDLSEPSEQNIAALREEFGFHPLALEDAVREQQRPKVDSYGDYYFVVFYCIGYNDEHDRIETAPIHMFIGPNYLVTIHSEPITQIDETLKRWQAPDSPLDQDVGALVWALLDAVVDDYFPVMDRVADQVEALEQALFERYSDDSLQTIFQLKKDLLSVRRIVAPERDVLNVMLRREIKVFDAKDVTYLQDVYDHIVRTVEVTDNYRDLMTSAHDLFLTLQSNRLNQIVKVLTIASIALMSMSLITGIYGMNFDNMPELRWQYGYPMALGLMVVVALALFLFFKRIKWL